jgi:uncharacterized protein HemX
MSIVIVLVVIALIVGLVAFFGVKARADHRAEAQRYEAHSHRELADATEMEATRLAVEAGQRTARAKHEQELADQQRLEADRKLQSAADLRTKADELDPDVTAERGTTQQS